MDRREFLGASVGAILASVPAVAGSAEIKPRWGGNPLGVWDERLSCSVSIQDLLASRGRCSYVKHEIVREERVGMLARVADMTARQRGFQDWCIVNLPTALTSSRHAMGCSHWLWTAPTINPVSPFFNDEDLWFFLQRGTLEEGQGRMATFVLISEKTRIRFDPREFTPQSFIDHLNSTQPWDRVYWHHEGRWSFSPEPPKGSSGVYYG